MELRRYAAALRRGWVLLVLCPLLAALVAGAVTWRLPPTYEATGSLLVRPAEPLEVQSGSVPETADEITQTYGELVTEGPVLQKVINGLRLKTTPNRLAKDITVTPRANTTILDVVVSNSNRVLAAEVANRLMTDFITTMQQVQTQENTPGTVQDNFVIVQPAVAPVTPSSPNIPRTIILAALVGLLLAAAAVLLRDYLDQSVKSDQELVERTGLVPVGHVPFSAAPQERRGELTVMQESSHASEAYRSLRTNLLFSNVDRSPRTIVVTSPAPDEGKSRTAANLAIVLAQSGHSTVLVDADFRRPSQHRNFGFVRNLGFSNLVIQEMQDDQALLPVEGVSGLTLLPSGPPPPNPSELLGSARARDVVGSLQKSFEFVVLDTPPVNAVTDAAVLATFSDGVVLVIESGRTSYGAVTHAKQTLERVGANVIGAVLNKMRPGRTGEGYGYEYYYRYTYAAQNDGDGTTAAPSNLPAVSDRTRRAADSD